MASHPIIPSAEPSTAALGRRIKAARVANDLTLETASRQIFIGKVLRLHARDELIDTAAWRVRLQHYFPVGRFGASDYVTTRERFTLG